VVDLGALAIAKRLLVARSRCICIRLDFEAEYRGIEALGRSERCDDYRGLEGLGCKEELDGEVFLRLHQRQVSKTSQTLELHQTPSMSLTIWTLPSPLSLTVSGNGASSPDSTSLSTTKAWCGRLALPLSFAVKLILTVSELPKVTGLDRGDFEVNLVGHVSELNNDVAMDGLQLSLTSPSRRRVLSSTSPRDFPGQIPMKRQPLQHQLLLAEMQKRANLRRAL